MPSFSQSSRFGNSIFLGADISRRQTYISLIGVTDGRGGLSQINFKFLLFWDAEETYLSASFQSTRCNFNSGSQISLILGHDIRVESSELGIDLLSMIS